MGWWYRWIEIRNEKMDIVLSRTNIGPFITSLLQVSIAMLKYTLQLWESIINTKYETWFGTNV